MKRCRCRALGVALFPGLVAGALFALSPMAFAAEPAVAPDHAQMMMAPAAGAPTKPDGDARPAMAQQMQAMQAMQAMHARMMAAKTPAERAKLMQEQMTVMQTGMGMMQGMQGMASAQRMDMMQMMMQMMMDHMAAPAAESPKADAPK